MFRTLIQVNQLPPRLPAAGWTVVDCRFDLADPGAGYRRFKENHIPGAVYANLDRHLSGPPLTDHGRHPLPSAQRMIEVFSALGISSGDQVVAYDDAGGSFAARLWWMLHYMGHEAAAVLDGGWQAWQAAGRSGESGDPGRSAADFTGSARAEALVTLEQVPGVSCLVDSRDPSRYRGESEPLDPAAGHIPGARNYFWKSNLDSNGCFLSASQLRGNLDNIFAGSSPAQAVFYCGSGVSACHNVLAATHAGFPMPRLYVGSWSEWCADPARPIAVGAEPG